jgi:DNA-binding PadR family transcriptional regulator
MPKSLISIDNLEREVLGGTTMLRYLVLGLLRDGKARHGYALMKAYRAGSGLHISTGNFYRELARLLASGCVEAVERAATADPRRTPYRITTHGAACFDQWFAAPLGASHLERLDDLALRLLVLPETEPALMEQTLERWKNDLWLRAKLLEQARDQAVSMGGGSDGVRSLLLGRRLSHLAADIELLHEVRHQREAKADAPGAGDGAELSAPEPAPPQKAAQLPRRTASRRQ